MLPASSSIAAPNVPGLSDHPALINVRGANTNGMAHSHVNGPVTITDGYNALEIILWAIFGIECIRRAVNGSARRIPAIVAAVTFVLFAASDAVEIATGAWWKPWWLFVWKASL